MTIQIQSISDPAWFDFVSKQENANIFHHPAWAGLLAECYDYQPFVLTEKGKNGQVRGGIPFIDVNSKLTGRRWVSLPFSDFCTPLYTSPSVLESLVEYLLAQSGQGVIPRVEIRSDISGKNSIYHEKIFVWHKLRLLDNSEEVFQKFHKTRVRDKIQLASRRGVEIRWGTRNSDIMIFYNMLVKTHHRLGCPTQPKHFFNLIWERIIEKGLGFLLLAYYLNKPIAGTVYIHNQSVLTAKYNASLPEYWRLRANNLIYWSAIKWGCENGFTSFDFGRTEINNQTLRNFKSGWGTTEQPLIYSIITDKQSNATKGWSKEIMNFVIRNSPSIISRLVGEMLYKHYA
jgi:hypothetical protein